ncbi:glycosyltransferase family 2 protein [Flavobacterium sp. N3904]|uniref:glycosyltransferase family 2 protein n=1 Tax=Flavobacterium sp. N3904 TaxID=2986835 RepID=UPI002224841B|nr:glycosyltransferase family 2 protein [Flavobacterium sp. N3904]
MIKDKILILLSTYNGENYLEEQLDSLCTQEGVEIHYLIRDDGSTDSTQDILKAFSSKNLTAELIFGKNIGCINSFTELLKLAGNYTHSFDYFAFCDQDDIWLKNKLFVAIQKLKKMSFSKPAMYCSNLYLIDEEGNSIGEMHKRGNVTFSKGRSLVESIATGCTVVFNRKVVDFFLQYQPSYMTMHDLWIFHMCAFLGEVFYDDVPHILYRQHSNNVIGSKATLISRWKNRMKSIKTLSNQHYRELEAKEMLRLYNDILLSQDRQIISIVAYYKKNLFSRLRFLLPPRRSDLNMSKLELNFWLKIRIVLGFV